MRIAYVCVDPGIPVFGTKGASVHVQEVTRELLNHGHEVTFYVTRAGKEVPADLAGLTVKEFKLGTKEPAAREEAQKAASATITQQIIADGMDAVYERYSLFSTVLADSGLPGVLEVNAPLIDEQMTHRELFDRDYPYTALSRQVAAARVAVCVSDKVKNWVASHAAGNIQVLANGVNTHRIQPQPAETNPPVVTFVGTLKPWHGTQDLLTAASLAQQTWKLRIIGDGPERENLEAYARELNLDVDFRGAVVPADIPAHLAGAAIGVAPYPQPESEEDNYFSPLKVYEYMAAGLAIVATRIGQVPEILQDAGTLVTPSAPAELARAIDAIVADPDLCASMSKAARQQALDQHSWAQVVTRTLEFADLVDGAHG